MGTPSNETVFIAHLSPDGTQAQTVKTHLQNTTLFSSGWPAAPKSTIPLRGPKKRPRCGSWKRLSP